MLPVQNIQVLVACKDRSLVPGKLELYYAPGKPAFEVIPYTRTPLAGNRLLLSDAYVNDVESGTARPVDSVRELHGHVLGLHDLAAGNPAGIRRICFMAEDAVFTMELREDGSLSECSWHCLGPCWDFPGYTNPDGTRFRQPMYPDRPWTKTDDTWGFTKYSWEETH